MAGTVKTPRAPRTRRAEQSEQTRRRILAAATALFSRPGYAATTIEAIASRADVAVETVYSRFRSKANLLDAVLGPAIVGDLDKRDLSERPEVAAIQDSPDQHEQIQLMAHLSRSILERTAQVHRILDTAAASDPKAARLRTTDRRRRHEGQSAYIEMLLANGPLRDGLSAAEATDTYACLANPATYDLLTEDRGWSAAHFEKWLADSLVRLLLP